MAVVGISDVAEAAYDGFGIEAQGKKPCREDCEQAYRRDDGRFPSMTREPFHVVSIAKYVLKTQFKPCRTLHGHYGKKEQEVMLTITAGNSGDIGEFRGYDT
jgi:hypothetical protein